MPYEDFTFVYKNNKPPKRSEKHRLRKEIKKEEMCNAYKKSTAPH